MGNIDMNIVLDTPTLTDVNFESNNITALPLDIENTTLTDLNLAFNLLNMNEDLLRLTQIASLSSLNIQGNNF
jgi:hypothetical protein